MLKGYSMVLYEEGKEKQIQQWSRRKGPGVHHECYPFAELELLVVFVGCPSLHCKDVLDVVGDSANLWKKTRNYCSDLS